jgi:structure-specific endonuclease subunit SLX1
MSYVYLLLSSDNATYIGATVDLDRRLRQHNKEIKGGAHATGAKVAKGETWIRAAHVAGFPDWQAALQFEWRWKQISRKLPAKMCPLLRRFTALDMLLKLERPTTKARAYTEWELAPEVIIEDGEARKIYEQVFMSQKTNTDTDANTNIKQI